jgi:hypothetical protein
MSEVLVSRLQASMASSTEKQVMVGVREMDNEIRTWSSRRAARRE